MSNSDHSVWSDFIRGVNVPIEQEEQDESRQVFLRNVRLLLETDEDKHHHDCRDGVV